MIARRLSVVMVVVALAPLALGAGLSYVDQRATLLEDAASDLNAIATTQAARVAAFEEATSTTLALVARRTGYASDLAAWSPGDIDRSARIRRGIADAAAATRGLVAVHSLAPDLTLIASTDPQSAETHVEGLDIDVRTPRADARRLVDGPNGPDLLIRAETTAIEGRVVGITVIAQSLQPIIDLAADFRGLGSTGETQVGVALSSRAARFVTPSRFEPRLTEEVIDDPERALVQAIATESTTAHLATDYRGQSVIAATRQVHPGGWAVVVKVDRDEAFAPVRRFGLLVLLSGLAAIALVIVGAVIASRRIVRPVVALGEVAEALSAGDLDARADAQGEDEIGRLAQQFNAMADRLLGEQARLDAVVRTTTAELREALDELQVANAELDSFSSVAAHDLKSPLAAVKGFQQLLAGGRLSEDKEAEVLDRMGHTIARMHALIEDLLSYARAGREVMQPAVIDLPQMVAEVLADLPQTVDASHDVLPAVVADPVLLRQVLSNLITNATKYVEVGQRPHVQVTGHIEGAHVVIDIDDNGIGVPEDQRSRIVEPFVRGPGAKLAEGTGVGLAICTRIIRRHDGTLEIADSPLGGARFRVRLPLTRVPDTVEDDLRRSVA